MKSKPSAGFTLIEALVVISITAILVAIGVPSFQSFVAGRAVIGQVSEVASALRLARAEAIKRGAPVTVCRTEDPQAETPACAADGDWATGWVVFVDRGATGVVDDTDVVVQVHDAVVNSGGITRVGTTAITFLASGVAVGAAGSFMFRPTVPEGTDDYTRLSRLVCVNFVGSTRMADGEVCV
ncbi:GspH/FimT family pseudopilin [Schlegelella sp. S2-27]|uniref:Type II secretion system protein H n=1 Tax=Caldimonas mangrovi TaxID=2944811 RepID=A0ABT0YLQ0_9BURK|nr:GspH/FimT family pseudopilin [Caldimonas mangrovi]MCM5679656.1 GspH/FimT family pseudopilin [Caldimonas mangrovi]